MFAELRRGRHRFGPPLNTPLLLNVTKMLAVSDKERWSLFVDDDIIQLS